MVDIIFWYVFFSIFIFGLIIGSFLNCLIWRAHVNESALAGRSYCPKCRHELSWIDLVPVFSFLFLKGRCRYCSGTISWQYPAVELVTSGLFLAVAFRFFPQIFSGEISLFSLLNLTAYWGIIAALVVIFVADLRWYFIPDGAVIFGLAAAVFLRVAVFFQDAHFLRRYDMQTLADPLLSAMLAGAFFLAIFLVSRGRWIGFGDVKYAFFMGIVLGFPGILVGLFMANFFGAIIGSGLIAAKKKKMSSEIPFGPFLVGGTLVAMFFSQAIFDWYITINF